MCMLHADPPTAYAIMVEKRTPIMPDTHHEQGFLAHLRRQVASGEYRRADIFHPAFTEVFETLINHMEDVRNYLEGHLTCDVIEGAGGLFIFPSPESFTPEAQIASLAAYRAKFSTFLGDTEKILDFIAHHQHLFPIASVVLEEAIQQHGIHCQRIPLYQEADNLWHKAYAAHYQRDAALRKLVKANHRNPDLPMAELAKLQGWLKAGYTLSDCQQMVLQPHIKRVASTQVAGVEAWWRDIRTHPTMLATLECVLTGKQSNSIRRKRVINRLLGMLGNRQEGRALMQLVWPHINGMRMAGQSSTNIVTLMQQHLERGKRLEAVTRTISKIGQRDDFTDIHAWCVAEANAIIEDVKNTALPLAA